MSWNPPKVRNDVVKYNYLHGEQILACGCVLKEAIFKYMLYFHYCLPAYKVNIIEDRDGGDES